MKKTILTSIILLTYVLICIVGSQSYADDTTVVMVVKQSNDFWDSILGTEVSHGTFAALLFWGFVGALIKLLLHARQGVSDQNNGTPEKFSFLFLFADNYKRLLLGAMLMFVFIRFYNFAMTYIPESYAFVSNFPREVVVVLAGFLLDYGIQVLKSKYPAFQVSRTPISKD